jgi:hypothetical protein
MATNAAPIYGKQYIRYAETWEATTGVQAGSPLSTAAGGATIGICEIGELRVVSFASYLVPQQPNVAAGIDSFASIPGNICGVNQAYMPTALAQPYTARQLTVATSGLLLIEATGAAISLNSALQVNALGQAVAAGTPVLLDGTTPIIRENVTIGGRRLVLVSFA